MSRTPNTSLIVGLAVGAGLLCLLLAGGCLIAFAGCGRSSATTGRPSVADLPTRDEFRAKWVGKTKDEVMKGLGRPDRTWEFTDTDNWVYRRGLTRDPISAKNDSHADIEFSRETGRVTRIGF